MTAIGERQRRVLFQPNADNFMERAACRGEDTNTFFPTRGDRDGLTARAMSFCDRCVVRTECLERALEIPERVGIFGGASERKRRRIRAQRRAAAGLPPAKSGPEPHRCGTYGAAARHRRNHEPLDEACAVAEREYKRDLAARKRNAA
jgi:WhiB family transcriptional regulator, redox-sensing transcriptional regulator